MELSRWAERAWHALRDEHRPRTIDDARAVVDSWAGAWMLTPAEAEAVARRLCDWRAVGS